MQRKAGLCGSGNDFFWLAFESGNAALEFTDSFAELLDIRWDAVESLRHGVLRINPGELGLAGSAARLHRERERGPRPARAAGV